MKGLRAVVLSGEGRAFCAGLDLSNFSRQPAEDEPGLTERTYGNANRPQQVAMQWRKLPVPVIAAVHGVCFGGGLQIASGADIRICHPTTRMAIMEMKWGLVPDMGGYALWRGLVRDDVLRELVYTHREFDGEAAVRHGFATHVSADPLADALALARQIAGSSPTAIRSAKQLANRTPDMDVDAVLMAESIAQHELMYSRNQIEAVRAGVLGRERDLATLRTEVSEMRAKMRDNLGSKATAAGTAANAFEATAPFDLKQDAGGIVDIEFMVQYAALAWSCQYPELLEFTDNIRILEGLERVGLLPGEDARLLQDIYKAYRSAAHRQALQKQPGVVSGDQFAEERRTVMRIWQELGLN